MEGHETSDQSPPLEPADLRECEHDPPCGSRLCTACELVRLDRRVLEAERRAEGAIAGWYWAGEPGEGYVGPFPTRAAAVANARELHAGEPFDESELTYVHVGILDAPAEILEDLEELLRRGCTLEQSTSGAKWPRVVLPDRQGGFGRPRVAGAIAAALAHLEREAEAKGGADG